ncbi:MAG TPA: methylglyoxal synthase, partial [Candidatus Deferrimicrobium sp.]|nr:methylglyoxal synthase [Candidatus Deferrimicrobium sp.]
PFPHFKIEDLKNFSNLKGKSKDLRALIEKEKLNPNLKDPVNLPLKHNVLKDFRNLFQVGSKNEKEFKDMTIALIAHDEMKPRMIDFAVDYETELKKFNKILATGTTGREVAAATSKELDNKLFRCHSGPKGGDIEIAAAILYGLCDVVIFFIDPLNAHPHIEDIRVVFQACMMNQNVIIITNEMHAREFMARVVRNNDKIDCLTN